MWPTLSSPRLLTHLFLRSITVLAAILYDDDLLSAVTSQQLQLLRQRLAIS